MAFLFLSQERQTSRIDAYKVGLAAYGLRVAVGGMTRQQTRSPDFCSSNDLSRVLPVGTFIYYSIPDVADISLHPDRRCIDDTQCEREHSLALESGTLRVVGERVAKGCLRVYHSMSLTESIHIHFAVIK